METSATTGTGTYTLAGAVTGFQDFSVLGNGNSACYTAEAVDANGVPSGGWEVGIGTYTLSGTTLSRDKILASSNSGSAVSWGAGTKRVFIVAPAAIAIPEIGLPGGRLTTESGVAISTSDRTSQGTLYYTPYLHNRIALWNGNGWVRYSFSELSLSLTGVSLVNLYDVFVYDNAGTLTLELSNAWTNITTRSQALTTQDGVYVKSGATTRLWLGTISSSANDVTEDSKLNRFIWNAYNQVPRIVSVVDSSSGWTVSNNTIHQANGSSTNQVTVVCGYEGASVIDLHVGGLMTTDVNGNGWLRYMVGEDSATTVSAGVIGGGDLCIIPGVVATKYQQVMNRCRRTVPLGYHYYAWLEQSDGTYTVTAFGSNGTTTDCAGMIGTYNC